jgi:hypothetical protein
MHSGSEFPANPTAKEGRFAINPKRFNVEQIVAVLKRSEAGVPLAQLIQRVGIPGIRRGKNPVWSGI